MAVEPQIVSSFKRPSHLLDLSAKLVENLTFKSMLSVSGMFRFLSSVSGQSLVSMTRLICSILKNSVRVTELGFNLNCK